MSERELTFGEATANSVVRTNLLGRPGYTPYCGAHKCLNGFPRTQWTGIQFSCACGWESQFPADFIEAYKKRWSL